MKRSHVLIISIAALLVLLLTACSFSLAGDVTPPPGYQAPRFDEQVSIVEGAYPVNTPDLVRGGAIYADKCLDCHGPTGLGDGDSASGLPVPVAAIGTRELAIANSPLQWYSTVTNGDMENYMPPFTSLTDQERWDVIAYVYSLSAPLSLDDSGATLYAQDCASCHGVDLKGTEDVPVSLVDPARMVALSDRDIAATILNGQGDMPDFEGYGEDQLQALVPFIRSFTFPAVSDPLAGQLPATQAEVDPVILPENTESSESLIEEQPTIAVTGALTNGSGAELPFGVEVTLLGYDHAIESFSQTVTANASGNYRFNDVPWFEGRLYFITVDYAGMVFTSDFSSVEPGQTTLDLPVVLYETTSSNDNLLVDRLHIFFEYTSQDVVRVVMLFLVSNSGDEAVIPVAEDLPAIHYPLPEEARNLIFEEQVTPGRFVSTPDGFGDLRAVLPHSSDYQLIFAYELPYTNRLDFVQPFDLDVAAIGVFVPSGDIRLNGLDVSPQTAEPFGGVTYDQYELPGVSAGEELILHLRGRHPAGSVGGGSFSLGAGTDILVGGLVFVLALAAIVYYLRRESPGEIALDPAEERARLLDAIIALDERYDAGQISSNEHSRRRAELKAALARLITDQPDGQS
jgi:mono/diheme cytochrome c family protein